MHAGVPAPSLSSVPTLSADAPIGIFDSGFGGLTVARSVIDQLPHESVLYVGDTARQPYGPKPIGEVREYALECLDHLYAQGVKALVIACNSASAAMLRDARERYDVPVVEVIYPATRRAVAATRNGRIGVICTRATAQSLAYDDAFAAAPHVELHTQACPRFVEFVEQGITSGPGQERKAFGGGIDRVDGCQHLDRGVLQVALVLHVRNTLTRTEPARTAPSPLRVPPSGRVLSVSLFGTELDVPEGPFRLAALISMRF